MWKTRRLRPFLGADFWEGDATKHSFSKKKVSSAKRGEGFSDEGFGKDFYRKGYSVKRFGPFSERPDSENWKVAALIPFPKITDNGSEWRKFRVVPRSHPLRPLVLKSFSRGGNIRAFRLTGEDGDHFHCTVEPSSGHIRCRSTTVLGILESIEILESPQTVENKETPTIL